MLIFFPFHWNFPKLRKSFPLWLIHFHSTVCIWLFGSTTLSWNQGENVNFPGTPGITYAFMHLWATLPSGIGIPYYINSKSQSMVTQSHTCGPWTLDLLKFPYNFKLFQTQNPCISVLLFFLQYNNAIETVFLGPVGYLLRISWKPHKGLTWQEGNEMNLLLFPRLPLGLNESCV